MATATRQEAVTTTAIVKADGLGLSPEFMAELNLLSGTIITVTIPRALSEIPANVEQLIDQMCGMFAGGPTNALLKQRKEDEQATKW